MANANKYQFSPEEAIEKLYSEGILGNSDGFLQTLIDNTINIKENAFFWQEHFIVEGNEYDIDLADTQKNPAWTVRQIVRRSVPMADAMAPLSETAQLDSEGYEEKTGSIYQYGKGLFETSMSKIELQARLKELDPSTNAVLDGFVRGVGDLIKTHNYRLSNMAAQSLSRGGAYDNINTRGFAGVLTKQMPLIGSNHFVKAGKAVWTSPDCDIISQMQKLENDFRVANDIDDNLAFEWDIPYDMVVNTLMNNKFFIAEVNRYIRLYAPDKVIVIDKSSSNVDTNIITWQQLVAYSRSDISKISPIRIIKEEQKVQDITSIKTVNGWKEGVAVLRPLGYAGVVVHAKTADVKLMQSGEVNDSVKFSIAKKQNFLYVINKVVNNGMLKAYHTDIIGRYAPVLNETKYHLVVDTTQADV